MGSKCQKCGCDINDETIGCPNCGYRVMEHRLREQLKIANNAINGWRAEIKRLRAVVNKLPHTADGVPVVPGDAYYRIDPDGECEKIIARDNWASDTSSAPSACYPCWGSVYSNEEKAWGAWCDE